LADASRRLVSGGHFTSLGGGIRVTAKANATD